MTPATPPGDRSVPDAPRGIGLADRPLDEVTLRILGAWDDLLAVAGDLDLGGPTRVSGWRAHDLLVHLGDWDDHHVLERALASARAGGQGTPLAPDAANERVIASHRDASRREVLDALHGSRTRIAAFLAGDEVHELGHLRAVSSVGPLPVLGLLQAGCYELAVHLLDLAPAGARAPQPATLDAGVAALIDVTGALAAGHGVNLSVAAQTPDGGWRFAPDGPRWETLPVPAGTVEGTAVLATAEDLLDVSAGRASAATLLAGGRLKVQGMTSMLRLAPLLDSVPGIPGGKALGRAASGLSGVGRVLGRLPRWGR